jgi:trehalose-6-phosphate hydrolase
MKDGKQEHLNDINQPGVKDAIRKIKAVVNEFPGRFLVGEIGSDKIELLKQYQSPRLLDVVFNFNFGSIPKFSVQRIFRELQSMENNMPGYPTLFFGSHDMPRMMDRLAGGDPPRAMALMALILTAKGVPFIYYGDEIGMHNIIAGSINEMKDIQGKTHYQLAIDSGKTPAEALVEANEHNRDKSRSPMQWNGNDFAGYSSNKSWIKINPDYREVNVQNLSAKQHSILNTCKALIALRNKEKVLQYGKYDQLEMKDDRVFFTRSFDGENISVVINFGEETTIVLPSKAKILMGNSRLKANDFLIYRN